MCFVYIFILQVSRHQTQFEATLTDKLARLAPEVAVEVTVVAEMGYLMSLVAESSSGNKGRQIIALRFPHVPYLRVSSCD